MKWLGDKLKNLLAERGLTQEAFSEMVGVSRQTYSEWVKGQVPKGSHLLKLCRVLKIEPDFLFQDDTPLLVPAHRTRGVAKRTPARDRLAAGLAREYAPLLDGVPAPALQMVCPHDGVQAVEALAKELRRLAAPELSSRPLDYEHVFQLLGKLGICVVFRAFPEGLKDYAFYVRISMHRVIVVNRTTNVLDLIYPILHEVVHAVRDVGMEPRTEYTEEEESFCDAVASATQFPPEYVAQVWAMLKGKSAAIQVNTLKTLARDNLHAVFGIVKALQRAGDEVKIANRGIHGADANLRKCFPSISDCLEGDIPADFLHNMEECSPFLVKVLRERVESLTLRTLQILLDLPSIQDARQIREELMLEQSAHACPL